MPPVIKASPSTLRAVVDDAITHRLETERVGLRARDFIRDVWSPSAVASNYIRVIEENYPQTWKVKPAELDYLWGAGVSQASVLRMVGCLTISDGAEALCWDQGFALYRDHLRGREQNDM